MKTKQNLNFKRPWLDRVAAGILAGSICGAASGALLAGAFGVAFRAITEGSSFGCLTGIESTAEHSFSEGLDKYGDKMAIVCAPIFAILMAVLCYFTPSKDKTLPPVDCADLFRVE